MLAERGRVRILVIDDDPDVLRYLESVLGDHGFSVRTTDSSAEGLRLAASEPPDLICLDVSMPPPTGVKVYRELRGDPRLATIPVVLVTGVDRRFERFISTRRGLPKPDGYVAKPFRPEELFEVIDRILGPSSVH